MTYTTRVSSPVGPLLLAGNERALTGLWIEGAKYFAASLPEDTVEGLVPPLRDAAQWLSDYFEGKRPSPGELALEFSGSAFRREVCRLMLFIPYGETTTYGALAREMARRMGRARMPAQAVGGAVGHNPISIVIPCHRVLGADGSLTGYAGGLDKKRFLLRHEGVPLPSRADPSIRKETADL